MGIKDAIKGVLVGIKIAGKAKAALSALDDDTDGDNKPQKDELADGIKELWDDLIQDCKAGIRVVNERRVQILTLAAIGMDLIDHVAEAYKKEK